VNRTTLKCAVFSLLGKEPDAVIVHILSGDPSRSEGMLDEMLRLVPDLRHIAISTEPRSLPAGVQPVVLTPGSAGELWLQLRRACAAYRVALAPVLFDGDPRYGALRRAALLWAPTRILAFNRNLERHHLRLFDPVSSILFLRGFPLDRIHLRPRWLAPWKSDRSVIASRWRESEGRPLSGRPLVGVLSPYLPWPLAHGGAVRLHNLLRDAAGEFDIFLFAFEDGQSEEDLAVIRGYCARVFTAPKPRYREPRWASLRPPEVCEFFSRGLLQHLRESNLPLIQVEYTQMAPYGGDILVEHDVTFDLFSQVATHRPSLSASWDLFRWRRYETRALRDFRRVVVMSEKDRSLVRHPGVRVIPNGVDLERFRPEPEPDQQRLLFIGSFRHFPNVLAYRFFANEVWPLLAAELPALTATVVAGPDPDLYCPEPPPDARISRHAYVADVRPLYVESNVVIIPTLVSAGTNLKALEAMAMERAIVSTPSGVAGLGLEHEKSVLLAESAADFAAAIRRLILDPLLRRSLAAEARRLAVSRYGWPALGALQRGLWRELHPGIEPLFIRPMGAADFAAVAAIQSASPNAAQWSPADYLDYSSWVAELESRVAGFLVTRAVSADEREILNLAVAPEHQRCNVATRLLQWEIESSRGRYFLEVRESNRAARKLYEKLGFAVIQKRPEYYSGPSEAAIVMSLQSC
jgi:ribosomal protein S18 acetylase RimI-like enzyme/glycosyltransferase involved in cell wall biosynthesis